MKMKKMKMSNKMFTSIWSIVIVLLLVFGIVANAAANMFISALNNYIGVGKRTISEADGTLDWNTNFYEQKFATIQEAREENSAAVSLEIAEEGITLMKNNGVLPLEKGSKITPFGLRYAEPIYGGTGSGNVNVSMDYVNTPDEVMNEYFAIDSTVEAKLKAGIHYYLPASTAEGQTMSWQTTEPETESSSSVLINHSWMDEFNPSEVYDNDFIATCDGTVGIVFLGRVGGEGNDIYAGQNGAYLDGTEHALQMNEYEKETIRIAKQNCEKVVVVLESSNVMEISELAAPEGELSVDAIVWMGGAGATGFRGLAEILSGEVNPSGHLVDTWMTDIQQDPTSANFGENLYTNLTYGGFYESMVEYDEGIYVGYHYYETVSDLNGFFQMNGQEVPYGEVDENGNLITKGAVVYPFGYGLNYNTDFEQEIVNMDETGSQVTLTVKVTNNGTYAGKTVVQVYYGAPYTDLDVQYGIEKSTVNLITYAKTRDIAGNGGSETVVLTFDKEDMASYSYQHENSNGTVGCYMLEAGDYNISIRENSHSVFDSTKLTLENTIWYDGSDAAHIRQSEIDAQDTAGGGEKAETYFAATNQFQESNDHMLAKNDTLTRSSGRLDNNAQPPTAEDLVADDSLLALVNTAEYYDPETDEVTGNSESSLIYAAEAPVTEADNGLTLSDLRGVAYDDPKWDDLLDQLDLSSGSDAWKVALSSFYTVDPIESVGKPRTLEYDGPQGISSMFGDPDNYGCAWNSAPILAATFNTELAYKMGAAVGQEGLAMGASAWYAPGLNVHRSPFSGRNYEYYSEDSTLNGIMGENVCSGAADNGVTTVIKHLFLNDMETDRSRVLTWCNEQAMRETYLKAFEIVIKDSTTELKYISDENGTVSTKVVRACNGIMTSMGSIGSSYCGTNYNLCTNVLRNEMGFRGMIMTDMGENTNNSRDLMLRAGVDEYLDFMKADDSILKDNSSATILNTLRENVKHMCYMVANNSSMQGAAPGSTVSYTIAPWKICLIAINVIICAVIISIIIFIVRRRKDERKNPDKYKSRKRKLVNNNI